MWNTNPYQLKKKFGVKFSLREIRRIFPIELSSFELWKMPKLLIAGLRGVIFFEL